MHFLTIAMAILGKTDRKNIRTFRIFFISVHIQIDILYQIFYKMVSIFTGNWPLNNVGLIEEMDCLQNSYSFYKNFITIFTVKLIFLLTTFMFYLYWAISTVVGFVCIFSWRILWSLYVSCKKYLKYLKKKPSAIITAPETISQQSPETKGFTLPTLLRNPVQRQKLSRNGWRLPESEKAFLRNWLQLNMIKRLDINTIEPLAAQTSLTMDQVHDFLKAEKKRLKKVASQ